MTTSPQVSARRARIFRSYRRILLWVLTSLLAMFFIAAGFAKLTEPRDNLIHLLQWPASVDLMLVRGVGLAELVIVIVMKAASFMSKKTGGPIVFLTALLLLVSELTMLGVHIVSFHLGFVLTNTLLIVMTLPVLWYSLSDEGGWPRREASKL